MHDECANRAARDRPFAGFEWLVAEEKVQGRLPLPLRDLVSVDARGVAYFEKSSLRDPLKIKSLARPNVVAGSRGSRAGR